MKNKITVQETLISIRQHEKEDFISLTDIARYKDSDRSDYILQNWMICQPYMVQRVRRHIESFDYFATNAFPLPSA
jgi:ApbE superfamily uncharacterized protein (UPF0280 family)